MASPDNTSKLEEFEDSATFILNETNDEQSKSLLNNKKTFSFCELSRLAVQETRQDSCYLTGKCKIPYLNCYSLQFELIKVESVFVLTINMTESDSSPSLKDGLEHCSKYSVSSHSSNHALLKSAENIRMLKDSFTNESQDSSIQQLLVYQRPNKII